MKVSSVMVAFEVDSVAALRNVTKIKNKIARTSGYYAAGDGGNGDYWLDASDTSSADNGFTVIVAADGGRWKLKKTNGAYQILQAGVKLDGSNTVAQLNVALAMSNIDLVFPDGGVATVASSVHLYGSNMTLRCNGEFTILSIGAPATSFTTMGMRGSNIVIDGLKLDGNSSNPPVSGSNSAFNFDTTTGSLLAITLKNFKMTNYLAYGIHAFSAGVIDGLTFDTCYWSNFSTAAGCVQLVNPTTSNVNISNCTGDNIEGAAFSIRSTGGTGVVKNITVSGCVFDHNAFAYTSIGLEFWNFEGFTCDNSIFLNARMGLSCYGTGFAYSDLLFDNITSYCIEAASSKNGTMSGLVAVSYTDYGVIFYNTARDVSISNSRFHNSSALQSSNLGWGIMFSASGLTQDYTGFKISNVSFFDSSGIRLERVVDSEVTNCTFTTISVDRDSSIRAINALNKNLKLTDNEFKTSVDLANNNSGLMEVNGSDITVRDNNFVSTTAGVNVGNAICNASGAVISNTVFGNNKANNFAAAIKLTVGGGTFSATAEYGTEAINCTSSVLLASTVLRRDNVRTGIAAVGDVDTTLVSSSKGTLWYSSNLTANRTITLSTTSIREGLRFKIVRTGGGAFNLSVGGLKTLSVSGTWCEVEYTGSAWLLIANGTL